MKRRFARFLGLSAVGLTLLAGSARGQDQDNTDKTLGEPRPETAPAPALAPAPAAAAPVTEAFVTSAVPPPTYVVGIEALQWWYKKDAIPSLVNSGAETDSMFTGTQNDPK